MKNKSLILLIWALFKKFRKIRKRRMDLGVRILVLKIRSLRNRIRSKVLIRMMIFLEIKDQLKLSKNKILKKMIKLKN